MNKTVTLSVHISPGRKLTLRLPEDFPPGLADVVITPSVYRPSHLSDLLDPTVFGLWRDRDDIDDTLVFAQTLRERAWNREP